MPNHRFYSLLAAGLAALVIIASMVTEIMK